MNNYIQNCDKLTFNGCLFIRNRVDQAQVSRPANTTKYSNGDGGAFQYGFSSDVYETDIELVNCIFIDNKAYRNGGAVALQTVKTVIISNCTFENNKADQKSSSSKLLFENHFDKKSEGRGGALYFNPVFVHQNQQEDKYMTEVNINNCTFNSNKAYDGFAIYIEGDDPGTEFYIINNTFINNTKNNINQEDEYSIYRAVISSEILRLNKIKIIKENKFLNNDANVL